MWSNFHTNTCGQIRDRKVNSIDQTPSQPSDLKKGRSRARETRKVAILKVPSMSMNTHFFTLSVIGIHINGPLAAAVIPKVFVQSRAM